MRANFARVLCISHASKKYTSIIRLLIVRNSPVLLCGFNRISSSNNSRGFFEKRSSRVKEKEGERERERKRQTDRDRGRGKGNGWTKSDNELRSLLISSCLEAVKVSPFARDALPFWKEINAASSNLLASPPTLSIQRSLLSSSRELTRELLSLSRNTQYPTRSHAETHWERKSSPRGINRGPPVRWNRDQAGVPFFPSLFLSFSLSSSVS